MRSTQDLSSGSDAGRVGSDAVKVKKTTANHDILGKSTTTYGYTVYRKRCSQCWEHEQNLNTSFGWIGNGMERESLAPLWFFLLSHLGCSLSQ